MAANLTQANRQWASRPEDERFLSLTDLKAHYDAQGKVSVAKRISTRDVRAASVEGDHDALVVVGPNGAPVIPTHWAFGQLAQRAGAPANYLRDLPGVLAADNINYGLMRRDVDQIQVLLRKENSVGTLAAVTGPGYGRIWNRDIVGALINIFGDGVTGSFRVPGEFGQEVPITKLNTTIYGSDRDMFVFLADEKHKIEMKDRRDGKPGLLSRGFFAWNSEVGAQTVGIAGFLFDYVCKNRIVWGAEGYREIRIRHTSGAPHRWIGEVAPAIERYAESSTKTLLDTINEARARKLDAVGEFLRKRFTTGQAKGIEAAHLEDEGRPIETLWDVTVGVTAYARAIPYQDERVKLEREAGKILDLAA